MYDKKKHGTYADHRKKPEEWYANLMKKERKSNGLQGLFNTRNRKKVSF